MIRPKTNVKVKMPGNVFRFGVVTGICEADSYTAKIHGLRSDGYYITLRNWAGCRSYSAVIAAYRVKEVK